MTSLNSINIKSDDNLKMPVLFIGHGSPMNAIEDNEFSSSWRQLGKSLPSPKTVLCISAHWETKGTLVTAMDKPSTIHDFGGFPEQLFRVQYPAMGNPELANEIQSLIKSTQIGLDYSWGLDHGCWSILSNMYPNADVPVVQLSINLNLEPLDQYNLAKELAPLRKQGVLIIGSGNMVHNLAMVDWFHPESGYEWAIEANSLFKQLIIENNHQKLILSKLLKLA